MREHILGKTGRTVSAVGLGTWQLGADWGEVSEADALAVLGAAADSGVTFFDTADVYGDGRSEQVIGNFLRNRGTNHGLTVATKMGRRMDQLPENYVMANFRAWTDRSRKNLGVDTLDLVQLHCPPTDVVTSDEVYDALDTLVAEGAIASYGLSVETCSQALAAIAHPNVATVQIIVNAFRLKPLDEVLPAALKAGVGIIARVPLASGMLAGNYTASTRFADNDHRNYNRDGSHFDVGETFSGVDYAAGLDAAAAFGSLAASVQDSSGSTTPATTAQAAIAWVSQLEGVSTVIPGARSASQAQANAAAGSLPELGSNFTDGVRSIYDAYFRAAIHPRW
ncbi:aldo/keto reductase [Arthrobacter sp. E3]|uniref:aldo/keto reductase n=1 Tax=Arthrobacter sp. E3 TaxID=517402 RepID=UPI001A9501D4|nr:aldo/keto reductase [Arthrobacter sp. E3]